MTVDPLPETCEAGPCTAAGHWTIEYAHEDLRLLCDQHYAMWPVQGGMFRREMLAREWGWPKVTEPVPSYGEDG